MTIIVPEKHLGTLKHPDKWLKFPTRSEPAFIENILPAQHGEYILVSGRTGIGKEKMANICYDRKSKKGMKKYTRLPPISGKKLIKLLQQDGWVVKRRARHGAALAKTVGGRTLVTVVPDSEASLDDGTLGAILGPKQTQIGKKGLLGMVNKYGL